MILENVARSARKNLKRLVDEKNYPPLTLEQWFSTLEAPRPTKNGYEHFGGPPVHLLSSFIPIIELKLTYLVAA